jgi:hypothetical protein
MSKVTGAERIPSCLAESGGRVQGLIEVAGYTAERLKTAGKKL